VLGTHGQRAPGSQDKALLVRVSFGYSGRARQAELGRERWAGRVRLSSVGRQI
jgi:hypothetical protein